MLTYNSQMPDLTLPEYGRNIQRMVDHCLNLDDREQRNLCAAAIVKSMGLVCPEARTDDGSNVKLWHHLALLSHGKLDIDWPVDISDIQVDERTEPDPVPYDFGSINRRQYGRNIEQLIYVAADIPEELPDRLALISLIANQMKKNLLALNPDDMPDEKIYRDLYEMSEGRIHVDATTVPLHDFVVVVPQGKRKKKK